MLYLYYIYKDVDQKSYLQLKKHRVLHFKAQKMNENGIDNENKVEWEWLFSFHYYHGFPCIPFAKKKKQKNLDIHHNQNLLDFHLQHIKHLQDNPIQCLYHHLFYPTLIFISIFFFAYFIFISKHKIGKKTLNRNNSIERRRENLYQ